MTSSRNLATPTTVKISVQFNEVMTGLIVGTRWFNLAGSRILYYHV